MIASSTTCFHFNKTVSPVLMLYECNIAVLHLSEESDFQCFLVFTCGYLPTAEHLSQCSSLN